MAPRGNGKKNTKHLLALLLGGLRGSEKTETQTRRPLALQLGSLAVLGLFGRGLGVRRLGLRLRPWRLRLYLRPWRLL